jgi:hypothetical protein
VRTPSLPFASPRVCALVATAVVLAACDERIPTGVDVTPLPAAPVTLEITFPWSEFASNLAIFGGYSRPQALNEAIIALDYAGTLNARTLIRWGTFPTTASVRDSTGTLRTDVNLTFLDGYVALFVDRAASTPTGPVTFALGAIENDWHLRTATWTASIDTVGDRRLWPEAGAGPVQPVTQRVWDPSEGDSVQFFVDSATIRAWRDPTTAARGARIDLLTADHRIRVVGGVIRLSARSSINPDTVLVLSAAVDQVTFVYTPEIGPPTDEIRVGGAPAWRSVFDVDLPDTLHGPPALCAAVGCPFALGPQHISYAGLALTSRATEPAFQPTDTVSLDVRAVLSRASMPKSPLSASLIADPLGQRIGPAPFGPLEGTLIDVPITGFVKGYLAGADPSGRLPPRTLALLSAREPEGFTIASFFGPGGPNEPKLRMILTVSPPMELR